MPDMNHRSLAQIAAEIKQDWGNRLNGAAAPYVEALSNLHLPDQRYGAETGADMIRGFLMNAQTWRGETARRVKLELKALLAGASAR
jgi:hypothetical protein